MSKISVKKLDIFFGKTHALKNVTLDVSANKVLAAIGPAGSGKTTFLRSLNRLNDLNPDMRYTGKILLDGKNIYDEDVNPVELRRKVGMIFALPIPLPMSICENITYGPKLAGTKNRAELRELVEKSLEDSFLWDEVKDRLDDPAMKLSGGQQQRLCIARTLALKPDVILMDEPCSGLDPISTAKIEEAMTALKKEYTIIIVTNNTKQAARVGDNTAFFLMGELIEYGETGKMFTAPNDKRTEEYISGRFG
ncbi:phosphate ABC transporter ATP-binding protein [Candidatus Desantisbacteria bacterium CG_4_10_14_0_8_um_filter_48_22]|uniref:Phosphate ABC transporter ATP-binding protein n=1 Tax=Candidatus Desantisbacteria bacterium CG_4_10_14_0_8_um_filter_48_22 TaxID=1974543 RepID=A0A2M7SAI4_9BACT|nr:MAG: phosphate ABC transporter ATP-binding protein [Candidatus Desantisbacteria bacterium CG1_02_49_89]PIV54947.1 MAG: phosphate ABC transporter ATP-binding protein [Candidatus Desantisbacteria bacterium CG02_land_8_20_14_3_00_49_13]PIZ16489.1 MAG: phosphate ABC transporter ATP-binding protein [Candidatus Desantisbacteria bacterium CG_4_10_14_0_8_um_filter_48_22]PJB28639.1 MAG: phosphate ABC transporter ATP-binding protein [Candidatus Desantisbacteria bacterium CG_4_9_14_3_um_filter_50_7]